MKHHFTVLSKIKCSDCGTFLKQNLVDKKPDAGFCYDCYCDYAAIFLGKYTGHRGKPRKSRIEADRPIKFYKKKRGVIPVAQSTKKK